MSNEPETIDQDQGLAGLQDALNFLFSAGKVAAILLIAAFCLSGVTNLEQNEHGIVLRFGAVSGDVREEAGMVVALPYPIDRVVSVPAKVVHRLESDRFQYAVSEQEKRTGEVGDIPSSLQPGVDGYVLTADGAIVHVVATLQYQIGDSIRYALHTDAPKKLIKVVLDSAVVHVAAGLNAGEALREKGAMQSQVAELVQKRADTLRLGIQVDRVDLTVNWPRQLTDSINAVVLATQDADAGITAARLYERTRANAAESEASKIRAAAGTRAKQITSRAAADAQTFRELYPLYKRNPEVIRRILHQDRLKKVAGQVDEVFIVEDGENRQIRLSMPRSDRKDKEPDGKAKE
jgi:regulator of protease activity HflC (stomatin/prohibitin superfamily)